MPFITDRDLLTFEPLLCRDAGWVATTLATGQGTLSTGLLSFAGVDPAARGIAAGQLVSVGGENYEVTGVPGAGVAGGTIAVSALRRDAQAPPFAPPDATGAVSIITFGRHIDAAHEMILQRLGIAGLAESEPLHESRIIRTVNLRIVESCLALELIWGAAAGAAGAGSQLRQRAEYYAQRASALSVLAHAEYAAEPTGTRVRLSASARLIKRG